MAQAWFSNTPVLAQILHTNSGNNDLMANTYLQAFIGIQARPWGELSQTDCDQRGPAGLQ